MHDDPNGAKILDCVGPKNLGLGPGLGFFGPWSSLSKFGLGLVLLIGK
jgi:hypothetical protein